MPTRDTKQGDFIKSNFATIWPAHLSAFTRLLTQLREHFDGDLDLMLALAVIADRTRPKSWTTELLSYRQLTISSGDDHLQHPINIQSVADYSGIPRETVRRKVRVLQDKGWVVRNEKGHLTVCDRVATDLEDATGDTIAYLSALLIAFEAVGREDGHEGESTDP